MAEHYLSLSVNELLEDVLHHYRVDFWPKVEAIVASHSHDTSGAGVVLEGSALWPEFVTDRSLDRVAALWLTASDEVFRQRIHAGSMYGSKSPRERAMVDKFLERTLAYDSLMADVASRHGFRSGGCLTVQCGGRQRPTPDRNFNPHSTESIDT